MSNASCCTRCLLHLVGHFDKNCIMMHGTMNVECIVLHALFAASSHTDVAPAVN